MTTTSPVIAAKRNAVRVFFLLTFLFSWGVWIPGNLASRGLLSWPIPFTATGALGVFGPFFAAILTALLFDGLPSKPCPTPLTTHHSSGQKPKR